MLNLAVRNTNKLIREKSASENIRLGRFFTKKDTAALMAKMVRLDESKSAYTILDPGAGTGILSAAIIDRICREQPSCREIFLTCYEDDPVFFPLLEDNLERIRKKCKHDYDVRLFVTLYYENYLIDVKNHYTVTFFGSVEDKFDIIICNPPTALIDKGSPEAISVGGVSVLKISAAFLFAKVAALHLEQNGQLVIMLPTTVATASTLTPLRRELSSLLSIRKIHLFVGKQKNTRRAIPLKKSIIICYENSELHGNIALSASTDNGSAAGTYTLPDMNYDFIVSGDDGTLTLPKTVGEWKIVKYIGSFPETLTSLGLKMSTGLVIDSKCASLLYDTEEAGTIPIIRSSAIRGGGIRFPMPGVKKQYLMPTVTSLFQRNKNMIIIKRVPAKSDARLINSAVYFAGQRPSNQYISTHNKINFIDTKNPKDEMSARMVFGLFAILNSTIYDRYVSIVSKSTQINSKEFKALPLPPRSVIENIGFRLMSLKDTSVAACDSIVNPTFNITMRE
ncbi:MAG: N-6 DNA methylase [Clostridia bacterium]|nr:N-6 DNA methylase [Clostridia bacterium]